MRGVGKVPNLRTISSYRGEVLTIDLGKTFTGYLVAWMTKLEEDNVRHRAFEIIDNRYLKLSRESSLDYYEDGELIQSIEGVWKFDVKSFADEDLSGNDVKTIYRGTIRFENNVTGATSYSVDTETVFETTLQTPL